VADFKVGKVSHFYDKIGVAVIDVLGTIGVGDQIRFSGSNEFSQKITSMQVEHKKIKEAKKGEVVGLKVDEPLKKGDEVFKAS
jgi:putative protease